MSVMSVDELYDQTVRYLPIADRLRLATAILRDIPPEAVVDYRDEWSDEDLADFSRASWEQTDARLRDEENA